MTEGIGQPRYYRSPRADEVTGPFTRAEIDAAISRGEIGASTLLCVEGSNDWRPASELLFGLREGGDGARSLSMPGGGLPRSVGIGWSIAATAISFLVCCLPIGLVPLILASIANSRYASGDLDGGARFERQARGWLIASWILIAIGCAISAWSIWGLWDALESLASGGL